MNQIPDCVSHNTALELCRKARDMSNKGDYRPYMYDSDKPMKAIPAPHALAVISVKKGEYNGALTYLTKCIQHHERVSWGNAAYQEQNRLTLNAYLAAHYQVLTLNNVVRHTVYTLQEINTTDSITFANIIDDGENVPWFAIVDVLIDGEQEEVALMVRKAFLS